jgi:hypothetical protein
MKLTEALELLKYHQEWRLGAHVDQLHPTQVTLAIHTVLVLLANMEEQETYTKQEFLNAAQAGEVSMIDAKHIVSLLDEVKNSNK